MDGSTFKPTRQENGFKDLHRESQALLRYARRLRLREQDESTTSGGAGGRTHGAHRPTSS